MPELVVLMKRVPENRGKLIPHVEGEPNFYEIDRHYPLPPDPSPPGQGPPGGVLGYGGWPAPPAPPGRRADDDFGVAPPYPPPYYGHAPPHGYPPYGYPSGPYGGPGCEPYPTYSYPHGVPPGRGNKPPNGAGQSYDPQHGAGQPYPPYNPYMIDPRQGPPPCDPSYGPTGSHDSHEPNERLSDHGKGPAYPNANTEHGRSLVHSNHLENHKNLVANAHPQSNPPLVRDNRPQDHDDPSSNATHDLGPPPIRDDRPPNHGYHGESHELLPFYHPPPPHPWPPHDPSWRDPPYRQDPPVLHNGDPHAYPAPGGDPCSRERDDTGKNAVMENYNPRKSEETVRSAPPLRAALVTCRAGTPSRAAPARGTRARGPRPPSRKTAPKRCLDKGEA